MITMMDKKPISMNSTSLPRFKITEAINNIIKVLHNKQNNILYIKKHSLRRYDLFDIDRTPTQKTPQQK